MKSLDAILKEKTYADKIIETLTEVSGKKLSPDAKYWIQLNTREMNIKVKRNECVLRNLRWIEAYPIRSISVVQKGKIFSLSKIDKKQEALVLIPEGEGDKERHYIYLYIPEE